jgi:hypothetical protein
LFEVLGACTLYVGNNSGPKHIAALLGVPTIGVHSGVVDAVEWAPMGPRAMALRRNMACSPCYIERPEGCSRGMACLRGLEPAAVHQAAELLLARPIERRAGEPLVELTTPARETLKVAGTLRRRNGTIKFNGDQQVAAAKAKTKPMPPGQRLSAKANGASRCNGRVRPV